MPQQLTKLGSDGSTTSARAFTSKRKWNATSAGVSILRQAIVPRATGGNSGSTGIRFWRMRKAMMISLWMALCGLSAHAQTLADNARVIGKNWAPRAHRQTTATAMRGEFALWPESKKSHGGAPRHVHGGGVQPNRAIRRPVAATCRASSTGWARCLKAGPTRPFLSGPRPSSSKRSRPHRARWASCTTPSRLRTCASR